MSVLLKHLRIPKRKPFSFSQAAKDGVSVHVGLGLRGHGSQTLSVWIGWIRPAELGLNASRSVAHLIRLALAESLWGRLVEV
jgi:hypothetical protein